jgi:hypothetical protein
MLNNETLKDLETVLKTTENTLNSVEMMLDRELKDRATTDCIVDPEMDEVTNKYNIGDTLYLPIKVIGILKTDNDTIEYKVECSNTKELVGFKLYKDMVEYTKDRSTYVDGNQRRITYKTQCYIPQDSLIAVCKGVQK